MIPQTELKRVDALRARIARLEADPDLVAYGRTIREITERGIAALNLETARVPAPPACAELEAAEKELAGRLSGLLARAKKEEAVEPGRFVLDVKRSIVVSWEQLWQRMRETPLVQRALRNDPDAAELARLAAARDPSAPFVQSRVLAVDVVRADG